MQCGDGTGEPSSLSNTADTAIYPYTVKSDTERLPLVKGRILVT